MTFKKGINTLFRVLNISLFRSKYSLLLNLRVTNACNLRCIYCNVPLRDKQQLKKEEIFAIFDEVQDECVFVNLYGGEPLVREDIGEIIDYIKIKDGIFVSMSSNGILVPRKINQVRKLDLLFISLDGPEFIHDKHKGKGSYEAALEAIKIARENNIPVIVMTAISRINIHHFDHILDKANELDFNVVFQPVISGARDNKSIYPDEKEFKDFVNALIKKKDKHLSSMSKNTLKYYLKWPKRERKRIDCLVEKISCFIDADSSLYSCTTRCDIVYGEVENREVYNSVRDGGVKKAFINLEQNHCVDCWAVDSVEINRNPFLVNALKRLLLGKI